jgi:hypothetical protein
MTIREIIKYTTYKDVRKAIKLFYPNDKNDYQSVFDFLLTVKKRKQEYDDERLQITAVFQKWDFQDEPDMWYNVCTNLYSCSFRSWSKLANIEIDDDTWKHLIPRDIIAHFIWEITFYGNEEDTRKIADELKETTKEIKKAEKEGTLEKHLTPFTPLIETSCKSKKKTIK